jgi:rhodanese-related sulfurtransferase
VKSILLEALLVAAAGSALAFAANALSPRGLSLGRDYFPPNPSSPGRIVAGATNRLAFPTTNSGAFTELANRLNSEGLQLLDDKQTLDLFNDPARTVDQVIFIDARDEQHFKEGHIPGAYQFDRYHPENYLVRIIPVCQAAQKIVVYCTGGECEDSEFAARFLKDDIKIPGEKLFVYGGGITAWRNAKRPIETGERNSGVLQNPAPASK